ELLDDQIREEHLHALAHAGLDRVEPVSKQACSRRARRLQTVGFGAIACHGVVSSPALQRQAIRGLITPETTPPYIPTTSATPPGMQQCSVSTSTAWVSRADRCDPPLSRRITILRGPVLAPRPRVVLAGEHRDHRAEMRVDQRLVEKRDLRERRVDAVA